MDSDAALAALLQLEEQQQAAIVAAIERDLHKCRSVRGGGHVDQKCVLVLAA
jgi:hypothetical protein